MDDVRRFMRHVLPGAVTTTLLTLALFAIGLLDRDTLRIVSKANLGSAGVLLLMMAALGYILSNIYFAFTQIYCKCNYYGWEHRKAIKFIEDNSLCKIVGAHCKRAKFPYIAKMDGHACLAMFNVLWWFSIGKSKQIKQIDEYVDRLCDVVHSLGAVIVGSIALFLTVGVVGLTDHGHGNQLRIVLTLIGLLVFIMIMMFTYCKTKKYNERVMNTALCSYLNDVASVGEGCKTKKESHGLGKMLICID